MPTRFEAARQAMLGNSLARHCAMCRGEYCACCGEFLNDEDEPRGLQLCRGCWPDGATPFYPLHIAIGWNTTDGWTVCIGRRTADETGPKVAYWLLLHDRAECEAILSRYICCRSELEAFQNCREQSGHQIVGIFVGPRRLAALVEATQRDPRTGYDKRNALAARGGSSSQRRAI